MEEDLLVMCEVGDTFGVFVCRWDLSACFVAFVEAVTFIAVLVVQKVLCVLWKVRCPEGDCLNDQEKKNVVTD